MLTIEKNYIYINNEMKGRKRESRRPEKIKYMIKSDTTLEHLEWESIQENSFSPGKEKKRKGGITNSKVKLLVFSYE